MNLAEKYIEYLEVAPYMGISEPTWDDFFDYCDISTNCRTDFAIATILKQARDLI